VLLLLLMMMMRRRRRRRVPREGRERRSLWKLGDAG